MQTVVGRWLECDYGSHWSTYVYLNMYKKMEGIEGSWCTFKFEWWVDSTLRYCLIIWMCLVCHRTDTQICQEDLCQHTCSFIWRKKTKLLEKILDWRWWVPTVMKLLKCNQPFDCWDYYHLLDHVVKFLNIFVVSLTMIRFGSQYIVRPQSLSFKIYIFEKISTDLDSCV